MESIGIRTGSRTAVFTVLLVLITIPFAAHAGRLDPTASLDHGLDLYDDKRYENAETALMDLLKSSAFRRLDSSQQALAYSHIAYSKINRGKEKESLSYIDKALALSKREFGERSLPYLGHLRTKVIAQYWSDDRRNAMRTAENILAILERMDGDFRDEEEHVETLMADMRRSRLEEEELPVDLSEFYTACESIDDEKYLAKAGMIMKDYKLVGKDIRPDYKQSLYFKNAYIKHARESSKDRKSRMIYIPDDEHMKDWCVIYPEKKLIDRVVISASKDH